MSGKAMRLLWLVLKVAGLFVAIGPLVGLVVFSAGVSVLALLQGPRDAVWLGPFLLLYGLLFAHFIGAPWALIASLAASLTAIATGRTAGWIGPLSGAVSWGVAAGVGGAQLPPGPDSPAGAQIDAFGPGFVIVLLLTHLTAATVCWLLARRLIRRDLPPSGSTNEGSSPSR